MISYPSNLFDFYRQHQAMRVGFFDLRAARKSGRAVPGPQKLGITAPDSGQSVHPAPPIGANKDVRECP